MESRRDSCPCCNFEEESVDHLLHCMSNTHSERELTANLEKSMTEAHFDPIITEHIIECIMHWFHPLDIAPTFHNTPEPIQVAHQAQQSIGWNNLLRGYLTNKWVHADAGLKNTSHDTPTEKAMGAAIICPCIEYFLQRWIPQLKQTRTQRHPTHTKKRANQ